MSKDRGDGLLRFLCGYSIPERNEVVALEGRLENSQMVEGASYCPDIYFVVVWLIFDQFWCQVKRSSNSGPLHHLPLHLVLAHAQISQLDDLLIR
jgi:hypothetical protein